MIVFITPKVYRSLTLFISVLRIEHELVHGFSNNSLPCKQMTTFPPLFLVSTQLVNVPLLLQNEFAAKYRKILTKITGLSSETSSQLSSMESVSQLVYTIERLEGNPHLSPVVNGNGKLIKLFPAKLYCDIQKKFTWGVIKCTTSNSSHDN